MARKTAIPRGSIESAMPSLPTAAENEVVIADLLKYLPTAAEVAAMLKAQNAEAVQLLESQQSIENEQS